MWLSSGIIEKTQHSYVYISKSYSFFRYVICGGYCINSLQTEQVGFEGTVPVLQKSSTRSFRKLLSSRRVMNRLLITTVFLFFLFAILGESGILVARYIFGLFGPILGFGSYLLFFFSVFYKQIQEEDAFYEIFSFSVISGTVAIIFALTLNGSAILAAIAFLSIGAQIIDPVVLLGIAIGVVAPFIEEVAKAIPIFVLSRALFTSWGKKERRLFNNFGIIVLSSVIVGGFFTFLETYWYTFGAGIVFNLNDLESWQFTFGQIMIRMLSPLHITTTGVMGIGIAVSLYRNYRLEMTLRDYTPFYISFLLAFFFHGLWNGTLVIATVLPMPMVTIFHNEIPLLIVAYAVVAFSSIGFFYVYSKRFFEDICPYCENWHTPPYDDELHHFTGTVITTAPNLLAGRQMHKLSYCMNCNNPKTGDELCKVCNAATVFACANCKNVVPAYADSCWFCKYQLSPGFDDTLNYKTSPMTTVAVGFIKFMAGFYVPLALALAILGVIMGITPDLVVQFFFFVLIGLGYIASLFWMNSDRYKSLGISLARTLVTIFTFQLGLTLILIASIFLVGSILSFILYMVEVALIFWFSIQMLIGYRPLVHGGVATG